MKYLHFIIYRLVFVVLTIFFVTKYKLLLCIFFVTK